MQNKKLKAIILGSLSIALFVATYVAISNKAGNKRSITDQQELSQGKEADQGLYKQALDEYDVRMCEQISDESIKNNCLAAIRNSKPTVGQMIMLSQKGNYSFNEDDYADRSIEFLEDFLRSNPNDVDALIGMGYAYETKRDYVKALEYYNKALNLNLEYAATYNRIGHVYDLMDGAKKAESYYKKSLEIQPDYLDPSLNLARIYYRRDEVEKARIYFEKAYSNPGVNNRTKAEIGYLFSIISLDAGDLAKARSYVDQAVKDDPSFPMGWVGKGQVRFSDTKTAKSLQEAEAMLAEALSYFDKAIALNKNQTFAYLNKGRILSAVGRTQEAVDSFKQAKNILSQDTTLMGDEKKIVEDTLNRLLLATGKTSFFNGLFIENVYASDDYQDAFNWWVDKVHEQLPDRPGHTWVIQGTTAVCVPNGATVGFTYNPPAPCAPSWGAWGSCNCSTGKQSRSDGCGGSETQDCSCDGACGTASDSPNYSAEASFPGSRTTCNPGTANDWSNSSHDPQVGGSVSWICLGVNGGRSSGTCVANRDYYQCRNSSLPSNSIACPIGGNQVASSANANYVLAESCSGNSTRCESKCNDSQGGQCGNRVYTYRNGSCQVCTPNCCEKNTCIGQSCDNGCGNSGVSGIKDCRNENWQEVSPN
ncbi:MAG: hypothetical protein ACD_15C00012G0007 [uncultured bacterium]|nr:MAG: hypothetical protein ACD_15C00012G0007 [uncultured bacterium]HCU70188.1 hypothetical protein [Candidatus Moranbacteria bacterium]